MLIVGVLLLIFVLALFVISAAYWNNTMMQSTAQNASLTGQFTMNAALGRFTQSQVNANCQKATDTVAYVQPTCSIGGSTIINPWGSVQQVVKNSTNHLMLVPKLASGQCMQWYTAAQDPSKEVTFSLTTNSFGSPEERDAIFNAAAPFRPLPIPSGSGQPGAGTGDCSGVVTERVASIARSFAPPSAGF